MKHWRGQEERARAGKSGCITAAALAEQRGVPVSFPDLKPKFLCLIGKITQCRPAGEKLTDRPQDGTGTAWRKGASPTDTCRL